MILMSKSLPAQRSEAVFSVIKSEIYGDRLGAALPAMTCQEAHC